MLTKEEFTRIKKALNLMRSKHNTNTTSLEDALKGKSVQVKDVIYLLEDYVQGEKNNENSRSSI